MLVGCALPGVALAGVDPAPAAAPAPPPTAAPAPPPTAAPAPPPTAAAPPPAPPSAWSAPPSPAPQPYAPPPGYSAPPPGYPAPAYGAPPPGAYGYPPPPGYPPPAYFSAQRLAVLDAQLAALQQRREELTMVTPLTLLIGGGVVAVVGLAMIGAGSCATYADGTKVNPSCADNNNLVTPGAFMFLAGAVGVAVGIPMTISRSVKRHIVNHQIQSRQLEVNALRGLQPRVGFAPTPDGGGTFSLALDF